MNSWPWLFLWPLLWRWWGHHGQGKKDGIILIQGMWWYQKRTTTCKILFYPPKKYHHMPWITFFHPLPCWWPLITFISGLVPHTNSGSMGTGTFWRRARLNLKEEEDLWQRTRKDTAARYTTVRVGRPCVSAVWRTEPQPLLQLFFWRRIYHTHLYSMNLHWAYYFVVVFGVKATEM